MTSDSTSEAAQALLKARGASGIQHPGGTLGGHLSRVQARLAAWGASRQLQLAGLCHAAYSTDGFPVALLDLTERPVLAEVIGAEAEALVYLYGSFDRGRVYPQLDQDAPEFPDRFTQLRSTPSPAVLRAFMEITAANELDVVQHSPQIAAQPGPALRELFSRASRHLSAGARQAWADEQDLPGATSSSSP